jgi:hypothetical protein
MSRLARLVFGFIVGGTPSTLNEQNMADATFVVVEFETVLVPASCGK